MEGGYPELWLRTSAGAEVDLVLEGKFGCPFGILVIRDEKVRHYDKKILGVPFSLLCQSEVLFQSDLLQ